MKSKVAVMLSLLLALTAGCAPTDEEYGAEEEYGEEEYGLEEGVGQEEEYGYEE